MTAKNKKRCEHLDLEIERLCTKDVGMLRRMDVPVCVCVRCHHLTPSPLSPQRLSDLELAAR